GHQVAVGAAAALDHRGPGKHVVAIELVDLQGARLGILDAVTGIQPGLIPPAVSLGGDEGHFPQSFRLAARAARARSRPVFVEDSGGVSLPVPVWGLCPFFGPRASSTARNSSALASSSSSVSPSRYLAGTFLLSATRATRAPRSASVRACCAAARS